jgi:hypothetical protein
MRDPGLKAALFLGLLDRPVGLLGHTRQCAVFLLAGQVAPIPLLPGGLRNAAVALPFR